MWGTLVVLILGLIVLGFWLSRLPHFGVRVLRELPVSYTLQTQDSVSLIVAARDEAEAIEANVRSLLRQSYPKLELIIVDDRSSDATGTILDKLAEEFPQLSVIHNTHLPEGWLGKCWALHQGAQRAQGTWLIFCDGDVLMQPTAVEHAVATCQREDYQHLCMAPRFLEEGFIEQAVITSLTFLFYVFQDPRHVFEPKRTSAYMGVGAFNMIQRNLYDRVGGHEALRLEIVDDVFMGMLAKRHGGRSAFFLGVEQASLHWYSGVWSYIRGIEKNSFAGIRFSLALLVLAIAGQSLLFFAPLVYLLKSTGVTQVAWAASLLIEHGLFAIVCVRSRIPWNRCFFLLPALLVQFFAFARSAWITLRQGGVRWRGTFYPLAALKAAQKTLRGPLIPWPRRTSTNGKR